MNKRFRNRLGAAFIAAVSITASHAAGMGGGPGGMGGQQGMMGNPARMQQMMEQRNQMMKSMLKLTPGQEVAFNKFAGLQQEKP